MLFIRRVVFGCIACTHRSFRAQREHHAEVTEGHSNNGARSAPACPEARSECPGTARPGNNIITRGHEFQHNVAAKRMANCSRCDQSGSIHRHCPRRPLARSGLLQESNMVDARPTKVHTCFASQVAVIWSVQSSTCSEPQPSMSDAAAFGGPLDVPRPMMSHVCQALAKDTA